VFHSKGGSRSPGRPWARNLIPCRQSGSCNTTSFLGLGGAHTGLLGTSTEKVLKTLDIVGIVQWEMLVSTLGYFYCVPGGAGLPAGSR
jgi:hypothetical protein